jgi:hypothetical protein
LAFEPPYYHGLRCSVSDRMRLELSRAANIVDNPLPVPHYPARVSSALPL